MGLGQQHQLVASDLLCAGAQTRMTPVLVSGFPEVDSLIKAVDQQVRETLQTQPNLI